MKYSRTIKIPVLVLTSIPLLLTISRDAQSESQCIGATQLWTTESSPQLIDIDRRSTQTVPLGFQARPGQFPSTVAIEPLFGEKLEKRTLCTAVYIGQNTVLTAAHCLMNTARDGVNDRVTEVSRAVRIKFGSVRTSEIEQSTTVVHDVDTESGVARQITWSAHFDCSSLEDDIAAIRWPDQIALEASVPPARLSLSESLEHLSASGKMYIAGWGLAIVDKNRLGIPNNLLYAAVDLDRSIHYDRIVGSLDGRATASAACLGDSGGPLYGTFDNALGMDSLRLIALTSHGISGEPEASTAGSDVCLKSSTETVFTSLSEKRSFIELAVSAFGGDPKKLLWVTP